MEATDVSAGFELRRPVPNYKAQNPVLCKVRSARRRTAVHATPVRERPFLIGGAGRLVFSRLFFSPDV